MTDHLTLATYEFENVGQGQHLQKMLMFEARIFQSKLRTLNLANDNR